MTEFRGLVYITDMSLYAWIDERVFVYRSMRYGKFKSEIKSAFLCCTGNFGKL